MHSFVPDLYTPKEWAHLSAVAAVWGNALKTGAVC